MTPQKSIASAMARLKAKADWIQFAFGGGLFTLMAIIGAWACLFVLPSVFFLAWVIKIHKSEAASVLTEGV